MKKIVLLCAGGVSTSLLMNKMKAMAAKLNYACEIDAYPADMAVYPDAASVIAKDADIILLGPQVRFMKESVQKICVNIPVEVIDMHDYGRMNGEAVLLFAKNIIEQSGD